MTGVSPASYKVYIPIQSYFSKKVAKCRFLVANYDKTGQKQNLAGVAMKLKWNSMLNRRY